MLVDELLVASNHLLTPESSLQDLLDFCFEHQTTEAPIAGTEGKLGLIPFDLFEQSEQKNTSLAGFLQDSLPVSLGEDDTIYSALGKLIKEDVSCLPVLDVNGSYRGVVTNKALMTELDRLMGLKEIGSMLTLIMAPSNYSLQEIARIVEINDGKVLNLYAHVDSTSKKLFVTLKVNLVDIKHVVATFRRFGYELLVHETDSDEDAGLTDRYQNLMRYLGI